MTNPLSDEQRATIQRTYAAITTHLFEQLRSDRALVATLSSFDDLLEKETYANGADCERVYETFRPHLLRAWERLYLYRTLGEYDLLDTADAAGKGGGGGAGEGAAGVAEGEKEPSVPSQLFSVLLTQITFATDSTELARRDVFEYKDGQILRYLIADLKNDKFQQHGLVKVEVNLVAKNVRRELIVLHNLLISDEIAPELVPTLEEGGVLDVIQIYLKSEDQQVRFWALDLLGYMKNEDLVAAIRVEERLEFSVSFLADSLSARCAFGGAMLFEVLRHACNLSEMRQHQEHLVRFGLLPLLARIVKGRRAERLFWRPSEADDEYCAYEKTLAAKCLYSYAIHPDFSKLLFADEPLLKELLAIVNSMIAKTKEEKMLLTEAQRLFMAMDVSINVEMRDNPQGTIKEIISIVEHIREAIRKDKAQYAKKGDSDQKKNGPTKEPQPSLPFDQKGAAIPPIGHVFISYSHQNIKRAMQLRDLLKECEIPVWIDEEDLRGNSIEAMVLGLNDARLVILCLSDGYRQSEFCKREAEYTVLKVKPFQPVIVQEGFRMHNDWLCFVVGLQNWIDLSSDLLFAANKDLFLEQVYSMFYYGESLRFSAPVSATASSVMSAIPKLPLQPPLPPIQPFQSPLPLTDRHMPASLAKKRLTFTENPLSPIASPVSSVRAKSGHTHHLQPLAEFHVMSWNNEQVLEWIDAEGLSCVKDKYDRDKHVSVSQ